MKLTFLILIIAMILVLKFCKKIVKAVLSVVIVIAALYSGMISIDMNRVNEFKEPIFAKLSETIKQDDIFKGLGYRIEIEKDKAGRVISTTMYFFDKVIAGAIE